MIDILIFITLALIGVLFIEVWMDLSKIRRYFESRPTSVELYQEGLYEGLELRKKDKEKETQPKE